MQLKITTMIIALSLLLTGAATGQQFENKDTATDRQDYTWGTRQEDGAGGYFETTDQGTSWGHKPAEPEPERDWYDEVIITVSPDVGYGSQTSTTETTNSSGEVTGTTTKTTTN